MSTICFDCAGATPPDAITATIAVLRDPDRSFASEYDADLASGLERAISMANRGTSAASAAPVFGTACDYPSPLNLGAHMVARLGAPGAPRSAAAAAEPTATDEAAAWMEAVRQNIYQGGDNAGRGQFVAAMMAASAGMSAVPSSWIAQLDPDASEEIARLATQLTRQRAVLESGQGSGAPAAVCVDLAVTNFNAIPGLGCSDVLCDLGYQGTLDGVRTVRNRSHATRPLSFVQSSKNERQVVQLVCQGPTDYLMLNPFLYFLCKGRAAGVLQVWRRSRRDDKFRAAGPLARVDALWECSNAHDPVALRVAYNTLQVCGSTIAIVFHCLCIP